MLTRHSIGQITVGFVRASQIVANFNLPFNAALCTSRGSVEYKDLGVSNSFLWFFISVFLFFWLGEQLMGAILNLEILNIRVTNTVTLKDNPIWFILVCSLKLIFWLFSVVVVYQYIQTKLGKKGT